MVNIYVVPDKHVEGRVYVWASNTFQIDFIFDDGYDNAFFFTMDSWCKDCSAHILAEHHFVRFVTKSLIECDKRKTLKSYFHNT